jgi:hypothetical protein
MLEPPSSPSGFKWRRTAFARIVMKIGSGLLTVAERLLSEDLRSRSEPPIP